MQMTPYWHARLVDALRVVLELRLGTHTGDSNSYHKSIAQAQATAIKPVLEEMLAKTSHDTSPWAQKKP